MAKSTLCHIEKAQLLIFNTIVYFHSRASPEEHSMFSGFEKILKCQQPRMVRESFLLEKEREPKKWSKNEAYGPGLIHVKNSLSVQVTHMVYNFHSVWLVMKIKRMKNHIHVHEKSKVTTCKYSTMNAKEWDGEMDEKCKMNEKIPGGWQTTNEPLLISIHYLACKIG